MLNSSQLRAFRSLVRSPRATQGPPQSTRNARIVCIASGKGGTGKSVLATNLASLSAQKGERVLLVDFDAGLANAHLLLGLLPEHDLGHVLDGTITAPEAIVKSPEGLGLLSGGVGRHALANPTRRELDRLFRSLRPLEASHDLVLIDHGAGMSYSTVAHLAASRALLLVTTPEVTGLSDAYAIYKRALTVNSEIRVGLVINQATDERAAEGAWERFQSVATRFLGRAPEQVEEFLREEVDPVLSERSELLGGEGDVRV